MLANFDIADLKAEILSTLHEDIQTLFKVYRHTTLAENLSLIKSELLVLKTSLFANISTTQQDFVRIRGTVAEMDKSLFTCTDDIATLCANVGNVSKELIKLRNKCEDSESRSHRNNFRIVGVQEDNNISNNISYASKLQMKSLVLAELWPTL